jgi:hypothetical protein
MFILSAVSESVQQALEDLMPVNRLGLHNEVVDRFVEQGRAQGEASLLLRVLSARGLKVPAEIRQRVLSCADSLQLEAWADRAATAHSVEEVFG